MLHVLPRQSVGHPTPGDLSTPSLPSGFEAVEDMGVVTAWRLGMVLPKKQARRSVTRSLIRHQARDALRRYGLLVGTAACAQGAEGWVVRLKAPFDRQQFPSAASAALGAAVRAELDQLWSHLLKPARSAPQTLPAASGGKEAGA
nr:hypothetical protein [Aquabacterium olei]